MREEIEEERGHAKAFLARILFLDGEADVQTLEDIEKPESVRGIFDTQLRMEKEAREYYDKAANECREAGDLGSFELFMTILKDEEDHIDFVEEQFDLMELMGDQLYVARQVSSVSKEGAATDDSAPGSSHSPRRPSHGRPRFERPARNELTSWVTSRDERLDDFAPTAQKPSSLQRHTRRSMTMPIWRSDLHIEVFGNGIRINFSDRIRGKMQQAPFAGEMIRENKLVWLLAPIMDRDPNFVADEIIRWAEGEGLETSR